jgi:hypothetical protein
MPATAAKVITINSEMRLHKIIHAPEINLNNFLY